MVKEVVKMTEGDRRRLVARASAIVVALYINSGRAKKVLSNGMKRKSGQALEKIVRKKWTT